MRPVTTVEVEALAADLLNKLRLPSNLLSFALRNIQFGDGFATAENNPEPLEVILDICAEFPLLAAFILVRDTLSETGKHFLAEDPEGSQAYLLLRPLEQLGDACHGLAQMASFASPDYLPEAFRVSGGRLVLCGSKLGRRKIMNGIREYYQNMIVERTLKEKLPELLAGLASKQASKPSRSLSETKDDQLMDELRRFTPFKPTVH